MPSKTFVGLAEDGYIGQFNVDYAICWNGTHGLAFDSLDHMFIGQHIYGGHGEGFYIDKGFLFFDLSEIPPEATLVSAHLLLMVKTKNVNPAFPFSVVVQSGQPTYPRMPIRIDDFNRLLYSGNGGSVHCSNFRPTGIPTTIELNAQGLGFINKGGITKLCLRTDREIAGLSPIESLVEGVSFYALEHESIEAGFAPRLYVEWTLPVPKHTLTITATSGGTTDPTPGAYEHAEGSVVSVSAIPNSGFKLDHWELDGANMGDAIPYNVTMNTDHTLHAVFTELPEPPPGKHYLTISMTLGGSTYPEPDTYEYVEGAVVSVEATAIGGYRFTHWELDGKAHLENPIEVTMDTNHTVHAVFTPTSKPTPRIFDELWSKVAEFSETIGLPVPPKPPNPPLLPFENFIRVK